jgi:hypothetical protein
MLKKICLLGITIVLAIAGVITFTAIQDSNEKYAVSVEGVEIPEFSEVVVGFDHICDGSSDLPFMAGAVIDVDNDGIDELFLGGGVRQADGLFLFRQDHFVNIADQVGLVKQGDDQTLGAVVLDVDNNGYRDLVITRKTGIWLYRNNGKQFSGEKIYGDFSPGEIPLGAAIADLNRDGHFDMFVPAYLSNSTTGSKSMFNGFESGVESRLLINNGDDSFTDLTDFAGLRYDSSALQASFVDIDDDGLEDLVVAYAEGKVRTWKNRGDLLFENKKHPLSDSFSLLMGFGVGDYNNDGKIDIFISTSGSTVPKYLARAYLPQNQTNYSKWVLLKNKGAFVFEDGAEGAKLANYELSRGVVFTDLNVDGRTDLVVSQNHQAWPLHRLAAFRLPGRVFVQNKSGQFAEIAASGVVENRDFSITPLVSDFNQDGQPDTVYVNMAGRSKVFLSKRGENNFLKVRLPDTVKSLGAVVSVKTLSGKVLKQTFLTGKELCSDSSHVLLFGLGKEKVTDVMVHYQDGEEDQQSGVLFNTIVFFE